MFSNTSNFVEGVDLSFAIILGISLVFLVGVTVVMILFVIKYSRKRNPKASQIEGSNKLEIIWTAIPTVLVLVMFYFGWMGYKPMRNIPKDGLKVKTYAQMWSWSFEYPNGKVSDTLVVPVNKPVILDLNSRDVIHSLYIPAFRIKEDVVPGRENKMWFVGQEPGSYNILCAEYCGDRHSYMLSKVVVVDEPEYDKWVNDTLSHDPPGLAVLKKNGCLSCHSLDGSRIVGPSFAGLWNKEETVLVGKEEKKVLVDEAYIKRSVYNPGEEVVKGYPDGVMISYKNNIGDEDLQKIIEYFKSIK